jgi:hypothetical protein
MIGRGRSQRFLVENVRRVSLGRLNTLLERFETFSLQSSNDAHTCSNHTVPTGRIFWSGAVPGTSCQATIAPSLRDISQPALARIRDVGFPIFRVLRARPFLYPKDFDGIGLRWCPPGKKVFLDLESKKIRQPFVRAMGILKQFCEFFLLR